MNKIFFTSDWHLNEERIFEFNPFFRPFKSIEEQNETIINNCNKIVGKDDCLVHVGDLAMDIEGIKMMERINCKNCKLILGNYDIDQEEKMPYFEQYFQHILYEEEIIINSRRYYLNHYPEKAVKYLCDKSAKMLAIVGHIHSLWKVQPTMINVSVDAWHFKPVSEDTIIFISNAIDNFYDKNVFPYTYKNKNV